MSPSALRRQIGELLIAGFHGHQIPVELRSLAREFGLGGVILFQPNIDEPEQVAELASEAATLGSDVPLWVSLDQEGGRVARLKSPFTEWPPMATLGRSGNVALAQRFARALASELKAVGMCGKHFPGHGDTGTDSHLELPLVEHPPDRLRGVEFLPFKAAIEAGVAMIMTAHILVPALDEERPATLSTRVVTDMLRCELKFNGVILSDSLDEMKAITDRYTVPRAAVLAIEAGCDAVLICKGDQGTQAAALEALIHAAEAEELRFSRVEDALTRGRRARERFLGAAARSRSWPTSKGRDLRQVLGSDEHQAVADEMARYL